MKSRFLGVLLIFTVSIVSCTQIEYGEWTKVSDNNKFPEGPAWDASTQSLFVSNCYGDWITKIQNDSPDTLRQGIDSTYEKTNGMVFHPDGYLIACDYGLGAILKITMDGKSEILIDGYSGKKFNRPNDITFTKNGNFYFSDPKSYGKDKPDGRVFFYNFKTKNLILAQDSLCFPNGLAISPDDGKLYLSESAYNRVLSFDIDPDGKLSGKEVFVDVPGGDPDGMNFDVDGNMWLAHFGTGTVFVISPDGKILHKINAPGKKPSNVEFGGKDLTTLYLTEDETNSVYKMKTNAKGFVIY